MVFHPSRLLALALLQRRRSADVERLRVIIRSGAGYEGVFVLNFSADFRELDTDAESRIEMLRITDLRQSTPDGRAPRTLERERRSRIDRPIPIEPEARKWRPHSPATCCNGWTPTGGRRTTSPSGRYTCTTTRFSGPLSGSLT